MIGVDFSNESTLTSAKNLSAGVATARLQGKNEIDIWVTTLYTNHRKFERCVLPERAGRGLDEIKLAPQTGVT